MRSVIDELVSEHKRLSKLEIEIQALTNYSLEEIVKKIKTGELEVKRKDVQE